MNEVKTNFALGIIIDIIDIKVIAEMSKQSSFFFQGAFLLVEDNDS